jgi:CDP-diacylglycerol--glycerol-3-phosphate 3-phosphatidyltransferase
MLGVNGRGVARVVFTPPARLLVRLGVTPDAVTVAGTVATCAVALTLFPLGLLWPGAVALGALVCADALDGTMARLTGKTSKFGAFLDSTLDRVSDAAVMGGLTIFLARQGQVWGVVGGTAALALGGVVPYARARAEALGFSAAVGIAERSDRLIVALVAAFATGVGAPWWVLAGALGLLGLASAVTVGQRAHTVLVQARAADAPQGGTDPAGQAGPDRDEGGGGPR